MSQTVRGPWTKASAKPLSRNGKEEWQAPNGFAAVLSLPAGVAIWIAMAMVAHDYFTDDKVPSVPQSEQAHKPARLTNN